MSTELKTIHVIISGRVQMVMYRDFAQRKARGVGVLGTVRNLADGTVEIFAQGSEEVIAKYLKKLHRGSLLSHVEDVKVEQIESSDRYKDFVILS